VGGACWSLRRSFCESFETGVTGTAVIVEEEDFEVLPAASAMMLLMSVLY
jgi:hypothetical protein